MPRPSVMYVPRNVWVKIENTESTKQGLSLVAEQPLEPQVQAENLTQDHCFKATPDPAYLRKEQNDEIEWFAGDDHGYAVRFPEAMPFLSSEFVVPAGGSVCSGSPRTEAKPGERYKYEIWAGGRCVADPEIIIRPSPIYKS